MLRWSLSTALNGGTQFIPRYTGLVQGMDGIGVITARTCGPGASLSGRTGINCLEFGRTPTAIRWGCVPLGLSGEFVTPLGPVLQTGEFLGGAEVHGQGGAGDAPAGIADQVQDGVGDRLGFEPGLR